MSKSLLEINDLTISLTTNNSTKTIVDSVSFNINKGECLAIVGESGSGKTVTSYALFNTFPSDRLKITSGSIIFNNISLLELPEKDMQKIRGKKIGMVFQEPGQALNPFLKVKTVLREMVSVHLKKNALSDKDLINLLASTGIPNAQNVFNMYPFQLSGGLKQRVCIALALVTNPELLVADEPTSSLDPTISLRILRLFLKLKKEQAQSMLFISHDLKSVAAIADTVCVMYQGKIVEKGKTDSVLNNPIHPYTKLLMGIV